VHLVEVDWCSRDMYCPHHQGGDCNAVHLFTVSLLQWDCTALCTRKLTFYTQYHENLKSHVQLYEFFFKEMVFHLFYVALCLFVYTNLNKATAVNAGDSANRLNYNSSYL
jgi:hypothetical protein